MTSENDHKQRIRTQAYQALSSVIDPEVGINIVDLGLIYEVSVEENRIDIAMTLTTAGCPMGNQLVNDAKQALLASVDSTTEIDISLIWEPAWQPEMMSAKAKQLLGWK